MATKKDKLIEENTASEANKVEIKPEDVKKAQPKKSTAKKKEVIEVKAKETEPVKAAEAKVKATAAKTVEAKKTAVKKNIAPKDKVGKDKLEAEKAEKTEAPKNHQPEPEKEIFKSTEIDRGALILGGGLLFMGILLMFGRLIGISFGVFLWPFIFIVPGVLVFLTALSTESSSGEGLSILGGILTMLGIVFLVQSTTGWWASWAYAWALIAPTSVGFAQIVYGTRKDRDAIVQSGNRLVNIGLTMFAIGFVFFELILGVSGFGLRRFGLPVFPMMLIFAGLVIVFRSFKKNRK